MKCIIFLALVGVAFAKFENCNFKESTYSTYRTSSRSKAVDDAEVFATCLKGETLVECYCDTFKGREDDCDGSYIQEIASGFRCVAKNGAYGKGVVARAGCKKLVITCNTTYNKMPSTKCPPNYKLMACTLHSHFLHKFPKQPIKPRVKRDGPLCKTTKGCTNCKVQARCVRITKF